MLKENLSTAAAKFGWIFGLMWFGMTGDLKSLVELKVKGRLAGER
jgi:hypothetical protein